MKSISIIVPVFNEEQAVPLFYERLKKALAEINGQYRFDIIFSNNGSTDQTYEKVCELMKEDPRVNIVSLSRNFGYQASLSASLSVVESDANIFIDVDCEDPPEMIPEFIKHWEEGFDLVYGRRDSREEIFIVQWARKLFYRLTSLIADFDFIVDMAEFSLFSRRIREVVLNCSSGHPFIRSDLAFAGFSRKQIPYHRQKRIIGKTHYNFLGMLRFAVAGILSSSTLVLRLGLYASVPLFALNIGFLITLFFMDHLVKYISYIFLLDISFLVLISAFTGVYVARAYKELIGKPLFVIDEKKTHLVFKKDR